MKLFIAILIFTLAASIIFIFLTIKSYQKRRINKINRKIIYFDDSERKKDNYSLLMSVCGFIISVIGVILTLLYAIPTPTIYPLDNEARVYNEAAQVVINSSPFLTTYYTLDGSDPEFGNIYEDTFTITKTSTVSAKNKFLIFWSSLSQNTFIFEEKVDNKIEENKKEIKEENKEEQLQFLKDKGVPCHRLQLVYMDKSIEISKKSGDFVTMLGDIINKFNINEIKLTNTDYEIDFTEYHIEEIDEYGTLKTVIVFDEIPAGNYELVSNIDGYQVLVTKNMRLSTDRMQGIIGIEEVYWGRQIGLVNNNSSMLLPYYITVIDENKNEMNDIDCMFQYKGNVEFGEYTTEEDGSIPLCFMATEGEKITVIMREVFNWNDEYTCEVTFNDVKNPPVIVLYSDGRSEQIGENEYLGFYK